VRHGRLLLAALALLLSASSCAYYNTFYLARKYYFRATDGQPYVVERQTGQQAQNYSKSIEYSKKVLGVYGKSKWVDDAYLMWGRALIGRDDPLQTISMLQDFAARYPGSPLQAEATFYLGLAYRNARRYTPAVAEFDEFLAQAPKHALAPYAHLERARALVSLQRFADAAASAGEVLTRYPKHVLADRARAERAEALFQQGDHAGARADFRVLGDRAPPRGSPLRATAGGSAKWTASRRRASTTTSSSCCGASARACRRRCSCSRASSRRPAPTATAGSPCAWAACICSRGSSIAGSRRTRR